MTRSSDEVERNKAIIRAFYDGAERGDISSFGAFLHPDFQVSVPNYLPWGGTHSGAEHFLKDVLPQAAKVLDFSKYSYENFTTEGNHIVVLIKVGVEGSNAIIRVADHWDLKDGKVVSLLVTYYEPQALLERLGRPNALTARA
jgi:ketosteroid isomerase-like protein